MYAQKRSRQPLPAAMKAAYRKYGIAIPEVSPRHHWCLLEAVHLNDQCTKCTPVGKGREVTNLARISGFVELSGYPGTVDTPDNKPPIVQTRNPNNWSFFLGGGSTSVPGHPGESGWPPLTFSLRLKHLLGPVTRVKKKKKKKTHVQDSCCPRL